MTIREELDAARAELKGLRTAIESEDSDAIAKGGALAKRIGELEAKVADSDAAKAMFEKMCAPEPSKGGAPRFKSLGDVAVASFVGKAPKGCGFALPGVAEFKTDPAAMGGVQQVQYDRNVASIMQPVSIVDLFGSEVISGNALTFYRLANLNGAPSTVAENGAKPQVDFATTAVTVALTKVAAYVIESDEMLDDAPWLASAVDSRLVWRLKQVEEAQLLTGNGTAPNMAGVLSTSGIGSVTYANGGTMGADDIYAAVAKVEADSGFPADAIILNPADYQRLRLAKDSNNQYYGGGYFGGPYGTGSLAQKPPLWGVPTFTSSNITQGTALVGAFKMGASIIRKAGGGISIEASNSHANTFTYNQVTIRAEERMALAVRYPQAFVKVSEAPGA